MRIIDADAMIADLLTVDPKYESMIDWCIQIVKAQPTVCNSLNDLKKKLRKVCLNSYSTKDSKGRCQIYKRKDFYEWSMEAYERGEDYFYADPVNPVNPYGKHKLCEPRYAYELVGMLSKEEYEELFGVVSEGTGDEENDEKEE